MKLFWILSMVIVPLCFKMVRAEDISADETFLAPPALVETGEADSAFFLGEDVVSRRILEQKGDFIPLGVDPEKLTVRPDTLDIKDAIYEALLQLLLQRNDIVVRTPIIERLSRYDPYIVADAIFHFILLINEVYIVNSPSLIDAKHIKADILRKRKYRDDLLMLITQGRDIRLLKQYANCVINLQNIILKLVPDLPQEVVLEFLLLMEKMEYKDSFADKKGEITQNFVYLIQRGDRAEWVSLIDKMKAHPIIGYGSFSYRVFNQLLLSGVYDSIFKEIKRAFLPKLIRTLSKTASEFELSYILNIIDLRIRQAIQKKGEKGLRPVSIRELGIEKYTEEFFSSLRQILDTSNNPFIMRRAYELLDIMEETPEDLRRELFIETGERILKGIKDVKLRCWLMYCLAPEYNPINYLKRPERINLEEYIKFLAEDATREPAARDYSSFYRRIHKIFTDRKYLYRITDLINNVTPQKEIPFSKTNTSTLAKSN